MVEEMEYLFTILRKSYDAQAEYIKEIRSLKHDMQAHMIVLQYYLEEEKYDKAKEYLQDMRVHQEMVKRPRVETGNGMVNALITERWKQSGEALTVSCTGEIPNDVPVSEYDLCTIFSNLFSNAVEACEKLKKRKKEIHMEIRQDKEYWTIRMENPVEWLVDTSMLGSSSSKEEKEYHGFGIGNVVRAVKRNGGTIEFLAADDVFTVGISLPLRCNLHA